MAQHLHSVCADGLSKSLTITVYLSRTWRLRMKLAVLFIGLAALIAPCQVIMGGIDDGPQQ